MAADFRFLRSRKYHQTLFIPETPDHNSGGSETKAGQRIKRITVATGRLLVGGLAQGA